MEHIRHLVNINASPEKVFDAIITQEGLSHWWTDTVKASDKKGDILEFTFQGGYTKKIRLVDYEPNKWVKWEMVDGHPEWLGTKFLFKLEPDEKGTTLHFHHDDWKSCTDMYALCNHHWGLYLQSLKNYVEEGQGNPHQA